MHSQMQLKLQFPVVFGFVKFLYQRSFDIILWCMDYLKSRRIIQLSFKHENIKYTYVLSWLPAATAILGVHIPCRWLKSLYLLCLVISTQHIQEKVSKTARATSFHDSFETSNCVHCYTKLCSKQSHKLN